MNYLKPFFSLSRSKQIAISVCLAHFLAVFCLIGHHFITRRTVPSRPILVRTVVPKTASITPVQAPSKQKSAAPQSAPPVKKETAKKEANPKPAAVAKKPIPGNPPARAAAAVQPAEDKALLEIAQRLEALAVASEPVRFRPSLSLPSEVKENVPAERLNADPSYGEILISYLQNALDLPEFGEVKAKLEIDPSGRLIDCEILETKSEKNADFLRKRLPELLLPCFNETELSNKNRFFTIVFRNVEIH